MQRVLVIAAVAATLVTGGCASSATGNAAACAELADFASNVKNPLGPGDGYYPSIRGPLTRAYEKAEGDVRAALETTIDALPDPEHAVFGWQHRDEFAANLEAIAAACQSVS